MPRRSGAPVPLLCPWRSMRCSTSEPAAPGCGPARPALPPACPIRIQPAAPAILHGLARRTAPQIPEGFSHFVTSMTAPVASGWSGGRVGLAPTGKRRLTTAHTRSGHLGIRSANQLELKISDFRKCLSKAFRDRLLVIPPRKRGRHGIDQEPSVWHAAL